MKKSRTCETITIGSMEIMLAHPAELPLKWVGRGTERTDQAGAGSMDGY
jgi:hypothetical protein